MGDGTATIVVTIAVICMSLLRRYKPFREWVAKAAERSLRVIKNKDELYLTTPELTLHKSRPSASARPFEEYVNALESMKGYLKSSQKITSMVNNRAKELSRKELSQLKDIGYFSKLDYITSATIKNSAVIEDIIKCTLKELALKNHNNVDLKADLELACNKLGYKLDSEGNISKLNTIKLLSSATSRSNSVTESLNHLCRDWSDYYKCERDPLTEYITERIKSINIKGKDILIVVPGSGVGNIAYNLSQKFPEAKVDSIELSSYMFICNRYALTSSNDISISPFALYYSGQTSAKNQTRELNVNLSNVSERENLYPYWADFRLYPSTLEKKYDYIIVCTAYFIDTAENLFEYFNSIENLSEHCNKDLHWINIGPLKYGTRPKVQLTVEELTKLRKLRNWKDLHTQTVLDYDEKLNGYLTDYEGLYQGYYGLTKFHTVCRK